MMFELKPRLAKIDIIAFDLVPKKPIFRFFGILSGKVLCAILTMNTDFAIDDKESDDDKTTQTGQFRLGN